MTNQAAPRCPRCGSVMVIPDHALHDSQTCPWICNECRRGFWEAELTVTARALYRPFHHDWGVGPGAEWIGGNVADEFMEAQIRGTAIQPNHFHHLTTNQIRLLADRPDLETGFAHLVDAHLKGRG